MKQSFPLTQHFIFWCIRLTPTFLGCSLYLEVRKEGTIHTPKHCLRCRQWGEPSDPAQNPLDLLATSLLASSTPKSCSSLDLGSGQMARPPPPGSRPLYSAMQAHRPRSFGPPGQRPSKSQLSVQADPVQIWSKRQDWGKLPTTGPEPRPPELPLLPIP